MVSLIVATIHRTTELDRLLTSLDAQTCKDFEVIVIDQNPDDRLATTLQVHRNLKIRHLRSERGLSLARNVGLKLVQGDLIAFPDDDCWYPPSLLATVVEWFDLHREYAALFVGARSPNNRLMAPKFAPRRGDCTLQNILHCAVSFTAFMRRSAAEVVGEFDPRLGIGCSTRLQSGEDSDYFIRILKHNFQAYYESKISVYHPQLQSVERLQAKAYDYAVGIGFVLYKHHYSRWYVCKIVGRSLAGALLSLVKGKPALARTYLSRADGQMHGYIYGETPPENVDPLNPMNWY